MLDKLLQFFNIDAELEDQDLVYSEIRKSIIFRGTNLWILIFAIVLASVGLNMNSTAVIIGAMLISPLMGPINGIGYSIATYDFDLFRQALKNFLFAIGTSLLASTVYFALSPVSTAYSELLARTSPTIYDVIIALFGGLAGIVAISSRQKGNVIPGVAIATALMPPLCTAGYGIATGQFTFFFGAIYLFTINTIFIAMASVWISQLLKFPMRSIVEESRRKRINNVITLIILIVLLPSVFFGYKLVKQETFTQNATRYVSNVTIFEGNHLIKHKIDAAKSKILLIYAGSTITADQRKMIVEKANDFNLNDVEISIEQGVKYDFRNENLTELSGLEEQILFLREELKLRDMKIDSIVTAGRDNEKLLKELGAIYPSVIGCVHSRAPLYLLNAGENKEIDLVAIYVEDSIPFSDRSRLEEWLKLRLGAETVLINYQIAE